MPDTDPKIFDKLPDDADDMLPHHVALIGGIASGAYDHFLLATSFKIAGDILVDACFKGLDAFQLVYPIVYNYRHALELYLKAVVQSPAKTHDLSPLLEELKKIAKQDWGEDLPDWIERVILEFIEHDRRSTAFRYPMAMETHAAEEVIIDLQKLKSIFDVVARVFNAIYHRR